MESKRKVAGFVVVYLNEYGEDEVIFCDSLEEAEKHSKEFEQQGIPSKIFKEVQ